METAETLPERPTPSDIRRLADRMLETRQDSIDEMSSDARAALDAALPLLDEKHRQAANLR